MPEGRGNLRYKIWNPCDHWDHKFVNGENDRDGVWSIETLDLGASGDPSKGMPAVSHKINLREYGLSEEKEKELLAADCRVEAVYEEFDEQATTWCCGSSAPAPWAAGRA